MSLNESETRFFLIDPVLRDKGYDDRTKLKLETPAPVEPTGFKGKRKKGNGRTDYLLCVKIGEMPKPLPVGVLEAKKESEDPLKGMQQALGYSECTRFSVKYVFATNGRRYGEYDKFTNIFEGPFSFADFPTHADLTNRYAKDTGIDIKAPEAAIMFMEDSQAYSQGRYYQDAAIRAAFEKILQSEKNNEPPRILLSLATGSGKTIIAANLLWRLYKAGRLSKPALFLCDRDELREQAYNKLKAVFGDNARIVETKRGENAAKNARIHIATYQTLGLDEEEGEVGSFLSEHYSENAFSVIIIDECHRSAWGRWSEVLKRNHKAIQIGLTATPRQLRESDKRTKEDQEITANNHKYFGDPVYEYTLIQAQEDGYLAACEIVRRKISIDGKTFTSAEVMAANPIDAKTGREITVDEVKKEYTAKDYDDELMMPERIQAMCGDLFEQLCNHGGPEQKVIVFCTREIHAERVVIQLNNLYVRYCKERGKVPKDYYAFKCMGGANNGRDMIEPMRGSGERAFIACTVDLLATGVDIERLNAVVFFRYLESPILFYQMVGRGTRIDEPTKKYKFWLYDYTGVTDLFGTDFIVDPRYPKPKKPKRGEDDGGDTSEGGDGNDGDDKPIVEIAGQTVEVTPQGHYILCSRNGRDVKVPVEEYRDEMIRAVLREASNLNDFRQLWIETQKRRQLINHLIHEQYSPELLLQLEDMLDFDYYDLFASHGYNANALRRIEREGAYLKNNQAWFESMAPNAAIVLKNVGHQFYIGGTEALETEAFWEVPEIRRADGLNALRSIGKPAEIVKDAKRRLFWL